MFWWQLVEICTSNVPSRANKRTWLLRLILFFLFCFVLCCVVLFVFVFLLLFCSLNTHTPNCNYCFGCLLACSVVLFRVCLSAFDLMCYFFVCCNLCFCWFGCIFMTVAWFVRSAKPLCNGRRNESTQLVRPCCAMLLVELCCMCLLILLQCVRVSLPASAAVALWCWVASSLIASVELRVCV
jgi:hypothetical protein